MARSVPHTDIPHGGWVDRWLPPSVRPYAQLARWDRPIGTWLLLFPGWWSLALAGSVTGGGWPDPVLMLLFGIGAIVMRGAGCTVNDILDRTFDAQVERTRGRPIPSGRVAVKQALLFLLAQLLIGFCILVSFPPFAIALGAASLVLVFTYPLMKRITWWPQAFLGLTFNWGALLGWAAATGSLDWTPLVLYAAGIAWTLGYDTIYAHQDKEDDERIGVKSTALRLGAASRPWVAGFYVVTMLALGLTAVLADLTPLAMLGLAAAGLQLAWQVRRWCPDEPASCLDMFRSNRWFGWLVLAAFLIGAV